jgi:hypothetical protein
MDIEGFEFLWLKNEGALISPRIGQFLVEVHVHTTMNQQVYPGEDTVTFVTALESHGLRVFHQEVNRQAPLWGTELSLIQTFWSIFEAKKHHFPRLV